MTLSIFICLYEVGKGTFSQDYIYRILSALLAMLQLLNRVCVS